MRYEVFHHPSEQNLNADRADDGDYPGEFPGGEPYEPGYYWWALENTSDVLTNDEPHGPFDTREEAVDDTYRDAFDNLTEGDFEGSVGAPDPKFNPSLGAPYEPYGPDYPGPSEDDEYRAFGIS